MLWEMYAPIRNPLLSLQRLVSTAKSVISLQAALIAVILMFIRGTTKQQASI